MRFQEKTIGDGFKTAFKRNLGFFVQGEEDKQNDLRRNIITAKIILAPADEALGKKDKL